MEKTLLNLIMTVEAEKEKYEQVYAVSQRKRDTIIAGNADELETIVRLEKALDKEISALEQKRLGLIERIAAEKGVDADEVNVAAIAENGYPELYTRLKTFQTDFIELLKKQMALNDINKQLLETQLQYIEVFLDSVANSGNINNTYGNNGMDADASQRSGLIDQKI